MTTGNAVCTTVRQLECNCGALNPKLFKFTHAHTHHIFNTDFRQFHDEFSPNRTGHACIGIGCRVTGTKKGLYYRVYLVLRDAVVWQPIFYFFDDPSESWGNYKNYKNIFCIEFMTWGSYKFKCEFRIIIRLLKSSM